MKTASPTNRTAETTARCIKLFLGTVMVVCGLALVVGGNPVFGASVLTSLVLVVLMN